MSVTGIPQRLPGALPPLSVRVAMPLVPVPLSAGQLPPPPAPTRAPEGRPTDGRHGSTSNPCCKLSGMERVPLAIDDLVRKLALRPEIDQVILFGSRARGDAEPRSDVDIAISAPKADLRAWDEIVMLCEEADTLLPIDLVRLEEAEASFRRRIESEGAVLFDRRTVAAKPA